jgi:hypothetical protein
LAKYDDVQIIGRSHWSGGWDITTPVMVIESYYLGKTKSNPGNPGFKEEIKNIIMEHMSPLKTVLTERYQESGKEQGWVVTQAGVVGEPPADLTPKELQMFNEIKDARFIGCAPRNNSIAVLVRELRKSYFDRHNLEITWFV